jgi:LacI family transcriptional regulator
MNKKVSIKDIAQTVGVSTALVSYVLNNKEKEARVGKEIAQVIRDTAADMGYQPNQIAKSLKTGKSHTFGLIVADISNPFFANLARNVEDEAKKFNYTVIFASADENAEKSQNLINILTERQVDGFIIAPAENSQNQIEALLKHNIPLVLIDRYFQGLDTNYVVTNNYEASYNAVSHLIETGKKNIGMVAYKTDLVHMLDRKRGYIDALKDNKLLKAKTPLIKTVDFNSNQEEVGEGIRELFDQNPAMDALFFATNTLTLKGLKSLNKMQYKVPDDVAVVCFDESEAFDFFYSPLTYIEQPLLEMGRKAVQILIKNIADKKSVNTQLSIESKLIVRQSSAAVVKKK